MYTNINIYNVIMYDYTNLILHPYESSHILHRLPPFDRFNELFVLLSRVFFWGGDDHPTILGREYMVIPTMVITCLNHRYTPLYGNNSSLGSMEINRKL